MNSSAVNADHLDTVGEPRTFVAKGVKYIVGGPTDIDFPSENKEFSDYNKLHKEISSVVKTIKVNK